MTADAESPAIPQTSNRRFAAGAMASSLTNIFKIVLQIIMLPVMAKLLGPEEFGLYALALPTVNLIALFADGGLGISMAREQESSKLVWSSAFWALLLAGTSLAGLATGIGFVFGYLAHQPRLPAMIALLSLTLVFLTLSVSPNARLTRRKHLGTASVVDLFSTVVGAAFALVLAFHGAGAWSLAAQYVATYASRFLLLNIVAFHPPGFEFSFGALRPHLVSGGIFIGIRLADYSGRAVESLLIDRNFGTATLGNYNFANQISRFSTEAFSNVSWSALYVQALTAEKHKIALLHRQLTRMLGMILFPAMFLAAAAAPQLIDLFLGPKWVDLSFFLRVFCPLYAFTAICSQSISVLYAYNRFDLSFWCVAGLSAGRLVAIASGPWIGLAGSMYALVAVSILYCAACLFFPARSTGCKPLPVLQGLFWPALSSLIAVGIFFLVLSKLPAEPVFAFVALLAGAACYALAMIVIDRKNLAQDWMLIRKTMLS